LKEKEKLFGMLRCVKEFEMVFKKGRLVRSEKSKVRAYFLILNESNSKALKVAVSVSAKMGNSVYRNRFKRVVKESLRHEKIILKDLVENLKTELLIVFSPHKINQKNQKRIFLNEIRADVIDILIYICRELKQQNPA
jgi:ribonuclease P protein component